MKKVVVYEVSENIGWFNRCMEKSRILALGVDVGVRNMAFVLMGAEQRLGLMWHVDYGAECNEGGDVMALSTRVQESLAEVRQFLNVQWGLTQMNPATVVLGIEQQQKQNEKAWMAIVSGMVCQAFAVEFPKGRIQFQQPSSITSMDMQKRAGLPKELVEGVPKRDEKKKKVVQMMEYWLQIQGQNEIVDRLHDELCEWKKNGEAIKAKDRRDHVGDALFHAWLIQL